MTESIGWEISPGQSVEYGRFLQKVTTESEWLFRLQANPTKSIRQDRSSPDKNIRERGTIIPLVTEDQQKESLRARAESFGFLIPTVSRGSQNEEAFLDLKVVKNEENVFYKNEADTAKRKVTLRTAVYEGRLIVHDEMALRRALTDGIGRAKSYGYGLMTLRAP